MSEVKTITMEISPEEWERLEAGAAKFNLTPEAYALKLLRLHLPPTVSRMSPQEALDGLRELAKSLPPTDAVELVRAGREELEQRGIF
ncbi:MAG: hypothetical protein Fur0025_10340 [Oscillatoriaceae cyanobacterium]